MGRVPVGVACLLCALPLAALFVAFPDSALGAGCSKRTLSKHDWKTSGTSSYTIGYPSDVLFDEGVREVSQPPFVHTFRSTRENAVLAVEQFRNDDGWTLDDFYTSDVEVLAYADYTVKKARWYVVSGRKGDDTVYVKTFRANDSGSWFVRMYLRYPTRLEQKYNPIVECVEDSFRVF